jgi:hypothetical protein
MRMEERMAQHADLHQHAGITHTAAGNALSIVQFGM